jgi:hypothetical protein
MRRVIVACCSAALVAAVFVPGVVAATPAESAPLQGVVDMEIGGTGTCPAPPVNVPEPGFCWLGRIEGDVEGTIAFWETAANYVVGKAEHFFEVFLVLPDSGGSFSGTDDGLWNFSTFKFRSQGWVTAASEEWAFLVGYKFFEMGRTSNPDLGLPITADDVQVFMAKAKGG